MSNELPASETLVNTAKVSNDDIEALRLDALRAGDFELAAVCARALKGDSAAIHEVTEAIHQAKHDARVS